MFRLERHFFNKIHLLLLSLLSKCAFLMSFYLHYVYYQDRRLSQTQQLKQLCVVVCKSLHTHIFICLPLLCKPSLLSVSLDCQFNYFPDITKFHKASKWETSQFMYYDDVHHQQVQTKIPIPGVQSTILNITDSVIVSHPLMRIHRGPEGDFSSADFF